MEKRTPEYLKLYARLRGQILAGAWPTGHRLPSRRQISQEERLSVSTVEHALELLCQEGYVEARPRSGYYVCYREADGLLPPAEPVRIPAATAAAPQQAFPFPTLARAMRGVLAEWGERVLERSPGRGVPALREALSRYLARNRGIRVPPSGIVVGAGAESLYGRVLELLGRERVYGLESPSYEKIELVYRSRGARCEALPLGPDGIRSEALWACAASVLHVTPFRSFPSGVTASASKRGEYVRWMRAGDRYLVEDDFESEFSLLRKPEETLFSRAPEGRVLYMNTFSRTISPSLRVGYMALGEPLSRQYDRALGFYACPVPTFDQYVIARLLEDGEFERHVNRIRREMRKSAGK